MASSDTSSGRHPKWHQPTSGCSPPRVAMPTPVKRLQDYANANISIDRLSVWHYDDHVMTRRITETTDTRAALTSICDRKWTRSISDGRVWRTVGREWSSSTSSHVKLSENKSTLLPFIKSTASQRHTAMEIFPLGTALMRGQNPTRKAGNFWTKRQSHFSPWQYVLSRREKVQDST